MPGGKLDSGILDAAVTGPMEPAADGAAAGGGAAAVAGAAPVGRDCGHCGMRWWYGLALGFGRPPAGRACILDAGTHGKGEAGGGDASEKIQCGARPRRKRRCCPTGLAERRDEWARTF